MGTVNWYEFIGGKVGIWTWVYLTVLFSLMLVSWAITSIENECPTPAPKLAELNQGPINIDPESVTAWETLG